MGKKKQLFGQFPPVPTREWMDRIMSDLKGADFKRLVWKTAEGFDLMPFYREGDIAPVISDDMLHGKLPVRRGTKTRSNEWRIRQDIRVRDYPEANSKAIEILMKGVESVGFIIDDPSSITPGNIDILLRDIHSGAVELNFLSNGKAMELLESLTAVCTETSNLRGAIEADPIGRLMQNGTLCIPIADGLDYLAELTRKSSHFPGLRTIHLKASAVGNAGGNLVQELAFAASMGAEYMVQLTERGISAEDASGKIRFSFSAGPDFFPEIAKLRAARIMWATILNRFSINSNTGMEIHCVTSEWNLTAYDPYVNMLRTQTEAMSAVLGGTDSLTVLPFDHAFKDPDAFSERIARNQQLILKEEAGFNRVTDPAGGSYYIEKLTENLVDEAWKLFMEIEEEGGFLKSLDSGLIQNKIEESATKRRKDIASRKTVLLGTNQYPNTREKLSEKADILKLFPAGITSGTDIRPVNSFRGAAEIEKIRFSVERSEKKPHVFLFTFGNQVMRKARAQFSSVFFGCGGYRITDNPGFGTIEEGISAVIDTNPDIVVICSSDEEYASIAPEINKNLRDRCMVVIAGNPACSEDLKISGIEHFIHVKSDVPGMLRFFNSKLNIASVI